MKTFTRTRSAKNRKSVEETPIAFANSMKETSKPIEIIKDEATKVEVVTNDENTNILANK